MPGLRLTRLDERITPARIGTLDATFGTNGVATAVFDAGGGNQDAAAAVAVQTDGKVVVVGSAAVSATDYDFAVARFNADGSSDLTFGSKGKIAVGFDLGGAKVDKAVGVAIDGAGRIVVVGTVQVDATDTDVGVIRLTTTGELDATFDTDGRATVSFDRGGLNADAAAGIALNAAGITVAATVQVGAVDFDFGVARLTDAGAPDKAFGTAGQTTVAFDIGGSKADKAAALLLQPGGTIVVAGSAQVDSADFDYAVARLLPTGKLDTSFNATGTATVPFDRGGSNADAATGVAIDAFGRLLLVGSVTADAAGDVDVGVTRVSAAGVVDSKFGTNGLAVVGFDLGGAFADRGGGVVVNSITGTIAVSATVDSATAGDTDVGVFRLTDTGALDPSFGTNGRAVIPFDRGGPNADSVAGLALQPSGRLIVGATATVDATGDTDLAVARLFGGTELSGTLLATQSNGGIGSFVNASGTAFELTGTDNPFPGFMARPVVADLNGDGFDDRVYGVGPGGGSTVRIFFGIDPALAPVTLQGPPLEFSAFEPGFTGGVFLAAADIDGDGRAELAVSPDVGGGGRVQLFSVQPDLTVVRTDNFFGIEDPAFRGGCRVAMGDVDGDGRAELIVGAGFLGGPRTAVFDGRGLGQGAAAPPKLVGDFFAFPGTDATGLRNGVYVTAGDVTGDGKAELIFGGGPGGGPRVFVLDGASIAAGKVAAAQANPVANFFVAGDDASRGGVRLTVKDADGDGLADVVVASNKPNPALPVVRVYLGKTLASTNGVEPPVFQTLPYTANPTDGVYVG